MVDSPEEALEGLGRGLKKVAIAVPDGTRDVDVPRALRALRAHIDEATVVVGLGLHRRLTEAERAPLQAVGWPVVDHDPDACADLGALGGIPCEVHPAFVEADRILTLGRVELHQYAGFSGGHKGVSVGCGGRATLAALHARDLVCHPDVEVGRIDGNPFRALVDALGEHIGVDFALQYTPSGKWVGGAPGPALRAAAASEDPWRIEPRTFDEVVLSCPVRKAANFYQASRALTYLALSPRPPLNPGARLVLEAACPEGMGRGSGERAFAELMRSTADLESLLDGPAPRGAGLQRAFMLARLKARGYRLLVARCETAEELLACGIDATSEAPSAEGALRVEAPFRRLPQRPT